MGFGQLGDLSLAEQASTNSPWAASPLVRLLSKRTGRGLPITHLVSDKSKLAQQARKGQGSRPFAYSYLTPSPGKAYRFSSRVTFASEGLWGYLGSFE